MEIYTVFLSAPLGTDKQSFEKEQIKTVQRILGEADVREVVTTLIGVFPDNEIHDYPCGGMLQGQSLIPMLDIEAMLLTLPEKFKLLQEESTDLEIFSIFQIHSDEYIVIIHQNESNQVYLKLVFSTPFTQIQKFAEGKFQYVSMTEASKKTLAKEILAHC